ncbi:MAG: hypothetical protein G01um101413_486 [Parcubacteria group bacterium Gr01-1014_13]|nr:MAG: hypothetical protein G01um101413_486 [Parcubacteria group bacterium Gr01-1014_13]
MFVMLWCSCASLSPQRRVLTAAEAEANYQEFYKELTFEDRELAADSKVDHYAKAKAIADKKKVDRRVVIAAVTATMWQKVILTREVGVGEAKDISKVFKLDRATEEAFAQEVFAFLTKNDFCETAADVVYHFSLGAVYADKAINCAVASTSADYVQVARLACKRPGTKELQSKLINGWVENFKQIRPELREYHSYWKAVFVDEYEPMGKIADMCPLTTGQYADLFAIGLNDKKFSFAKAILEKDGFKKTPADYENFISLAVTQYECGMAAIVAIKQKLSDKTVEAIFLNPKCLGGTLGQVDPVFIPQSKAEWFFNLSLKAQEFVLARRAIEKLSLGKNHFDKLVTEGLAAQDYAEVLNIEPWGGERVQDYRDGILNKILDANEEWSVTSFLVQHKDGLSDTYIIAWNERAFLHALRRGAFDLAADIAHSDTRADFKNWGIRLAFDSALQARKAEVARFIARRYKLDKDALQRVAMLYLEINREKARQQALKSKRECEKANIWNVERCK